jgi:hypothetical protein
MVAKTLETRGKKIRLRELSISWQLLKFSADKYNYIDSILSSCFRNVKRFCSDGICVEVCSLIHRSSEIVRSLKR